MMHDSVLEFHNAFEIVSLTTPTLPEPKIRTLRQRLLNEEFKEYFDAEEQDDLVEMADALADICYVTCGTHLAYGLAPKVSFVYPKTNDPDNQIGHGEAALPLNYDLVEAQNSELRKALANYQWAETTDNLDEIDRALTKILHVASDAAALFKIPLGRLFAEVHRSNMTKLDENGKPMHNEFGKVIKSPLFEEPRVGDIIFDGFF